MSHPDGTLKKSSYGSQTTNYTYDGLNRLVSEQAPNKTYTYQYDSYGNRSQLSVTGDETYTTSYTYDKNNRMRNQTKTAGTAKEITDFWYDPNGNQISSMTVSTGGTGTAGVGIALVGADNTNSYSEYNSWNQLTKTMQNGKTASYTYNGDGLRMSKTVDGKTTKHIWDGTDIVGDVTDGTVTKYIRGLQLISSKNGSNENFYTYNGHGDVVQLTNNTGAITKQYNYDAFGVETNKTNNDTNPFRYCGEYYDIETDSVYLRARYYRPTTGRFITEDSYWNVDNMIYGNSNDKKPNINAIIQSGSLYIYCNSNPVRMIDPDGKYIVDSAARNIWRLGAEYYLRNRKGWYLTATLLELSTYGSGQHFEAHNGEYAADLIKYNSGFRKQVNDYLWSNGTQYDSSYAFFIFTYAFDVSGGDLGAALHNVSVVVTAERNSDASWNTFIQVYDTFDFTEFRNPFLEDDLKSMFLWTMNDLAYLDQAMNVIEPVEVYIDFYDTY